MNLKPSTHASTDGFSAVEVLVAMTITSVFAAAALSIAFSSQGLLEADERRTTVNQNLRAGIDLLGIDIRQAGERLPGDAPAIQIMDGSSGAPDSLMLRRNQLDYVMPLCKNINAGSSADSVFVGKKKITGKVPPGCYPVPDANGDGWPDNLEAWRNYRIANGGSVVAYIHNPITGLGEFFTYDAEDNSTFHLHKANGASWQHDYLMNEEPRIYILEQKEFRLLDGVLQCVINDDTSNALNLVSHIEDFQLQAIFTDGTVQQSFGGTDDWIELQSIEVALVGQIQGKDTRFERTLVSRFFPRNILSN